MTLQTITPPMAASLGLAQDPGIIVADVWPGGPAEAAGVKPGMCCCRWTARRGEPADRQLLLPSARFRQAVRIVVRPGGRRNRKVTPRRRAQRVRFGRRGGRSRAISSPSSASSASRSIRGIATAAKGLRDPYGIIVAARAAGGAVGHASAARDIIRSFNNRPIFTIASLREILRGLKPGAAVTLQVQRAERLTYVTFTLE